MELWIEEILGNNSDEVVKTAECPVAEDVADGETILGTLEGKTRIFKIASTNLRKLMDKKVETHYEHHKGGEECKKFHNEIEDLKSKISLLSDLFWIEVKRAIPTAANTKYGIGVRKDWQIVSLADEKSPALSMDGFIIIGGRF